MPDDQTEQRPDESSTGGAGTPELDAFNDLVLDETFVRGGRYEPPARTRVAIARYGDEQTSWRHGGGLRAAGKKIPASTPAGQRARESRAPRTRQSRLANARGAESRLPVIITAIVVITVAFMLFR